MRLCVCPVLLPPSPMSEGLHCTNMVVDTLILDACLRLTRTEWDMAGKDCGCAVIHPNRARMQNRISAKSLIRKCTYPSRIH